MITEYNEIYHNPFLLERISSPSSINVEIFENNKRLGKYIMKFNFWNELTFIDLIPNNFDEIIISDLRYLMCRLIFMIDNNNLPQTIRLINNLETDIKMEMK